MIAIVYDVTNEISFNSCIRWVDRIRHIKPPVNRPGKIFSFDSLHSLWDKHAAEEIEEDHYQIILNWFLFFP